MTETTFSWQAVALLVVGAILGGFLEEFLDNRREHRENVQGFVESFNDAYYGNHRDHLHQFFVGEDVLRLVDGNNSRAEFEAKLVDLVKDSPDTSAAIFAIFEFYRTINLCVEEGRCKQESIELNFAPYAELFYQVFYPVLRLYDCELDFPNSEMTVLRVFGGNDSEYTPPCNSTRRP